MIARAGPVTRPRLAIRCAWSSDLTRGTVPTLTKDRRLESQCVRRVRSPFRPVAVGVQSPAQDSVTAARGAAWPRAALRRRGGDSAVDAI
eukprot:5132546-Pleurochrysis_carterae.AAC.3